MKNTNICWAGSKEKSCAFQLRYEMGTRGQGLFSAGVDHQRGWLRDEYDDDARVLLAREGERVVGTMRLLWGSETHFTRTTREAYDIDMFATVVSDDAIAILDELALSSDGAALSHFVDFVGQAAVFARKHGIELLVTHCKPHAIGHCQLLGFRPYGSLYHHPHQGLMVSMALVIGDDEHLNSIKSPVCTVLAAAGVGPKSSEHTHTVAQLGELIQRSQAVTSEFDCPDFRQQVVACFTGTSNNVLLDRILCDPQASRNLLQHSHILECTGGEVLFLRGEQPDTVYILLEGSVWVSRDDQVTSNIEHAGALVGEAAFLNHGPCASTAVANTSGAKFLALNLGVLNRMFKYHDALATQFLQYISMELSAQLAAKSVPLFHSYRPESGIRAA
jgi:CRP-like cAMP-binding protein